MWTGAQTYEYLMGRWSHRLARPFLQFAEVRSGHRVLDVGCGTGALTRACLEHAEGLDVVGVDPAAPPIEHGRRMLAGAPVRLEQADAQALPFPDHSFDRCLSLLVINFLPDAPGAVREMLRVTLPGGVVAAAVWDYGEGMEMLRILWDAAVALDPAAGHKHERSMPYCRQGELTALWADSGFRDVEEQPLVITLHFASFMDYWEPFLAPVGPSGSYVSGLPADRQQALRERLLQSLAPHDPERAFSLQARAWAVRGTVPDP